MFRWVDVSAAAAAGSRSPFYPESLASAALGAVYRGDLRAADTAARAALEAARPLGSVTARRPLEALGDVAIFRGGLGRAARLYGQAYDLSAGAGDHLDAAWDNASAAVALGYGNRLDEARRLARQAQAAADVSGAAAGRGESHAPAAGTGPRHSARPSAPGWPPPPSRSGGSWPSCSSTA